jgi:galactose-1-phosphate uridylyltransferase
MGTGIATQNKETLAGSKRKKSKLRLPKYDPECYLCPGNERAGGMNLLSSDPTLTHVTISGNTSAFLGGGMNITLSNPTLTHVTISGNTAPVIGLSSSNAKLINSVF